MRPEPEPRTSRGAARLVTALHFVQSRFASAAASARRQLSAMSVASGRDRYVAVRNQAASARYCSAADSMLRLLAQFGEAS